VRALGHHESVQYVRILQRVIPGSQHPSPGTVARGIAPNRQDKQNTMNRVTLGGLACGLALLLAACSSTSSGPSANGPFGNGGPNSGTVCYPAKPGGVVFDGFEEFSDTGGMATVSKVTLVRPRHLRLAAAWVANANDVAAADGRGYPTPGRSWQRIPGAVVHHTRGTEGIALVIVVKPSGKLGTATAVNLYYNSGGTHYLLHFPYGPEVPVGHECD